MPGSIFLTEKPVLQMTTYLETTENEDHCIYFSPNVITRLDKSARERLPATLIITLFVGRI